MATATLTTQEVLDHLAAERRSRTADPIDAMFVDWVAHWVKVDAGLEPEHPFDYSI